MQGHELPHRAGLIFCWPVLCLVAVGSCCCRISYRCVLCLAQDDGSIFFCVLELPNIGNRLNSVWEGAKGGTKGGEECDSADNFQKSERQLGQIGQGPNFNKHGEDYFPNIHGGTASCDIGMS